MPKKRISGKRTTTKARNYEERQLQHDNQSDDSLDHESAEQNEEERPSTSSNTGQAMQSAQPQAVADKQHLEAFSKEQLIEMMLQNNTTIIMQVSNAYNVAGSVAPGGTVVQGDMKQFNIEGSTIHGNFNANEAEKVHTGVANDTIKLLHDTILQMEDVVVSFEKLKTPEAIQEIPKLLIIKSKMFVGGHKVTEEYIPDPTLTTSTYTMEGEEILLAQLFLAINEDSRPRHVMLSGSVGVGKSTLLKYFSKLAVQAVTGFDNHIGLNHIHLVLYLEFKFMDNKEILLRDLLIGQQSPKIGKVQKEELFQWMVENDGNHTLIVIDGLDQFAFDLDSSQVPTEYHKPGYASSFVKDLFGRRLLPKAFILTSSREHAMRKLGKYLLPERIVAVDGLKEEAIDRLIVELSGEDGENIKNNLKTLCKVNYLLCANPLYLQYVVAVQKQNPGKLITTTTELMMNVICYLMEYSEDRKRKINLLDTRMNLMEMAYQGTKSGKVMFHTNDLKTYDIDNFDDLVIIINKKAKIQQRVLKGHTLVFFTHQILQEVMASIYICSQTADDFKEIVEDIFKDKHYSVVVRLLMGLVFNKNVQGLLDIVLKDGIADMDKKQDMLLAQVNKTMWKDGVITDLEHLRCLYEANKKLNINPISIRIPQKLQDFDVFCLASIICTMGTINNVLMYSPGYSLTTKAVELMSKIITHDRLQTQVRIGKLMLVYHSDAICDALWELITAINVDKLHLICCSITSEVFRRFMEKLQPQNKIHTLNFFGTNNIKTEQFAEVVVKTESKKLILPACDVTHDGLLKFKEVLQRNRYNWRDEFVADIYDDLSPDHIESIAPAIIELMPQVDQMMLWPNDEYFNITNQQIENASKKHENFRLQWQPPAAPW